MKEETIRKLKEISMFKIIEKEGKIIFIRSEINGKFNKKKTRN